MIRAILPVLAKLPSFVAAEQSDSRPEPVTDGPEGAFRVTIVDEDFGPSFPGEIEDQVGDYTLSISDGRWHLLQENGWTWETGGSYTVSGDTITFTDHSDPNCFGWTSSVRWELVATELSFSDPAVDPAQPCGDDEGLAWTSSVFGSRPWSRIVS